MKSLQEKIGQMLMVGFHGLQAPSHILDWLKEGQIGGVILFARNVDNPQQVAELCKSIHEAAKFPALIAIDQEGGMVARLREPSGFTESPGAMALASAQDGEIQTEKVSAVLGAEMRSLGINWNYAPSVDISYNAANPTVGTRSFGKEKDFVAQMAAAAVRGFQKGGVAACAKHFPGLGNTTVDTHLELPILDTNLDKLLKNDLHPYRVAIEANLASIMTTHTIFSTLDENYPATLSPHIIQHLIREELAYEGIVVSDCMEMRAISDHYGAGESAVLGLIGGLDIVLMSHTRAMQEEAYDAMLEAAQSGRIPLEQIDKANARIENLKEQYKIESSKINIDSVASDEHRQTSLAAARAGLTVVQKNNDLFPLPEVGKARIALIEFASHMDSEVMERNQHTAFATLLQQARPDIEIISLNPSSPSLESIDSAQKLASTVDILLLASRNAHMMASQKSVAEDLLHRANSSILIALRNPYDASALKADAILCSSGDSNPSLWATVEALQGDFLPSGQLPVEMD